jgi:hypothetical protein
MRDALVSGSPSRRPAEGGRHINRPRKGTPASENASQAGPREGIHHRLEPCVAFDDAEMRRAVAYPAERPGLAYVAMAVCGETRRAAASPVPTHTERPDTDPSGSGERSAGALRHNTNGEAGMSIRPSTLRRMALCMARQAAVIMPSARSAWAEALRREVGTYRRRPCCARLGRWFSLRKLS